jgi:deoxyhypusine synthase
MGDMTFFFNISHPGMVVDSGRDALVLEEEVLRAPGVESAAVIAVGGGLPKHFALRACRGLLRDAVLITTTPPCVDGSVSSGTPEDEISQELLPGAAGAGAANVVHVRVEATLCFPFMCAMSLFHA